MAHRNERDLHRNSPVVITGVDRERVNTLIGTITHRHGQVGKTKPRFEVKIQDLYSVKEIRTVAYLLMTHHRLKVKSVETNVLWRNALCY